MRLLPDRLTYLDVPVVRAGSRQRGLPGDGADNRYLALRQPFWQESGYNSCLIAGAQAFAPSVNTSNWRDGWAETPVRSRPATMRAPSVYTSR